MIDFSRLKTWLLAADLQKKNNPLHQLLNQLITFISKEQGTTNTQIINNAGNISTIANSTLITLEDESSVLSNSEQLLMLPIPIKAGINKLNIPIASPDTLHPFLLMGS